MVMLYAILIAKLQQSGGIFKKIDYICQNYYICNVN